MRRALAAVIVAVTALAVIIDGFVPGLGLAPIRQALVEGAVVLGAFALLAGMLNLIGWHWRQMRLRQGSPSMSGLLIAALLSTAAVTLALPDSTAGDWIYAHLYEPVQASLMALLAFYVVSATYRTLALRTPDAILLMVSAVLLLLLQLPFTAAISPALAQVRGWLLGTPIAGIMRGVLIGAALGAITVSLRVLLGRDRPQLGG